MDLLGIEGGDKEGTRQGAISKGALLEVRKTLFQAVVGKVGVGGKVERGRNCCRLCGDLWFRGDA